MPTNRTRRIRAVRPTILTPYMRNYLMGLPCAFIPGAPGKVELFMMRKGGPERTEKLREIWLSHRDEILKQWKTEKRRGKPWAERYFNKKGKIEMEVE